MKLVPLKQRTPAWEHWRSEGVTASEAPVILGRSPYKTPWRLWAERTGVVTPQDLSGKPCVQRGIRFEDQVRRAFEERHATLLLPLCAESSDHPVLRCSLDGLNDDGEPVELKVPTERTYRRLDRERELTTAYQLAWAQLQFQIFVTEAPRGWLVFDPCLAGSPPLEFAIARDEPFLTTALIPACLGQKGPGSFQSLRHPALPFGGARCSFVPLAHFPALAGHDRDLVIEVIVADDLVLTDGHPQVVERLVFEGATNRCK